MHVLIMPNMNTYFPRYLTIFPGFPDSLIPFMGRAISTSQGAVAVLCGSEGNCRSHITSAAFHRFRDISSNRLNGLRKKDVHSSYTSARSMASFTF